MPAGRQKGFIQTSIFSIASWICDCRKHRLLYRDVTSYRKIGLQLLQRVFAGAYVIHHQPLFEHHDAVAHLGHMIEVVAGDQHGHVPRGPR